MGLFAEWQPRYANEGVATFPLSIEGKSKKPANKGYANTGLTGSEQLALKFPNADAFAFMAGKRSKITVVDIDAPDEDLLRDTLKRYGDTPLITRTGSGGFHCYYRHKDEGRKVRPDPNVPVDILGGGVVAAPPSMGSKEPYRLIRGTIEDLQRLPFATNIEAANFNEVQKVVARELIASGSRNKALMDYLRGQARYADNLSDLLDVAHTYADEHLDRTSGHPFTDDEIQSVAKSVWSWTQERIGQGQYFVGTGRTVSLGHDLIDRVLPLGPHATALFMHLKRRFGGMETFYIANEMRKHMPDGEWPLRKMQDARKALIDNDVLEEKQKASSKTGAAVFMWKV